MRFGPVRKSTRAKMLHFLVAATIGVTAACEGQSGPAKGIVAVATHACIRPTPEATVVECTRVIDGGAATVNALAGAYLERANAYALIGDYSYAGKDFRTAVETVPTNIEARLAEARFLKGMREYEKAHQAYDAALVLAPSDERVLRGRGVLYAVEGDFDKALADHDAAIHLKPDDAQSRIARSYVYLAQRQPERALADIAIALELDPKASMAYFNRGAVYMIMGDNAAALSDYDRAIDLNPDTMLGYIARSNLLVKLQRYDQAADDGGRAMYGDKWTWADESGVLFVE